MTKRKDKATAKNCSIKRECLNKRKKKQRRIPEENAPYGRYAIFIENRQKERMKKKRKKSGLYVYTKEQEKSIFYQFVVLLI